MVSMQTIFRLINRLRRMSFIKRISLLTAITVIIAFWISIVSMHFLTSKYNDQFYKNVSNNLYSNTMQFSKNLEILESISMMTFASPAIQSSLFTINQYEDTTKYLAANASISGVLANYMQSYGYTGLRAITIYNNKYYHNTDYQLTNYLLSDVEEAISKAVEKEGALVYTFLPEQNMLLLSRSIRQIENLTLAHLGDMVIFVDMNSFMENVIITTHSYTSPVYFLYDGSEIVYSSLQNKSDMGAYLFDNCSNSYSILEYDGVDYFCVIDKIPETSWYLLNAIPYTDLTSATGEIIRNSLLVFLVAFIVLSIANTLMLRYAFDDYNKLVKKMKNFDISDESTIPAVSEYEGRTDELGLLNKQFDHMTVEIHELVRKNYVNEILKKDAQLKELKSQINPHFLYNTLETINWRAKAIHDTQISEITESLGFIFRASLDSKTSLVTIAYEIDLINAYMVIQRIRFEDRLDFSISCPEEIKKCMIPPMTVQPLLENSIKYGMEAMIDVCHLEVDISQVDDRIVIVVSNDGSLFEDDLLEKLENGDIKPSGHGIGLLNIKKRIQLIFGDEYGLEVYNSDDKAVARITIPYHLECQEQQ